MGRGNAVSRIAFALIAAAALYAMDASAADRCEGVLTTIEEVRVACAGAARAVATADFDDEDERLAAGHAMALCSASVDATGRCDDNERCAFRRNASLPPCKNIPSQFEALIRLRAQLGNDASTPKGLDPHTRSGWEAFFQSLYGERCRGFSSCWRYAKTHFLADDPADYRARDYAARLTDLSRRMKSGQADIVTAIDGVGTKLDELKKLDKLDKLDKIALPDIRPALQDLIGLIRDQSTAVTTVVNHVAKHEREAPPGGETPQMGSIIFAGRGSQTEGGDKLAKAIDGLAKAIGELKPPTTPKPAEQVDPYSDYETIFPGARSIGYALLLVPDPRVPRHRRSYDLTIAAASEAMLAAGFVLDRYSMPWQEYLDGPAASKPASGAGKQDASNKDRYADDGRFGVLLFRRDNWRSNAVTDYDVRALYVVAETASFGVQHAAFANAAARMLEKTGTRVPLSDTLLPRQIPLHYPAPDLPDLRPSVRDIVVLGPAFSGSLTSVVEALRSVESVVVTRARDCLSLTQSPARCRSASVSADRTTVTALPRDTLCTLSTALCHNYRTVLVSPATTATTNNKVDSLSAQSDSLSFYIHYQRLAVPDPQKLQRLYELLSPESAVLFAETSVFGSGICPRVAAPSILCTKADEIRFLANLDHIKPLLRGNAILSAGTSLFGSRICPRVAKESEFCKKAVEIRFPANIADIRYGQRALEKKRREQLQQTLKLGVGPEGLALEDGAENGSEFPESQRSPVSTASASLVLDRAISATAAYNPDLIVVAATDVRDRLFLFDRLRSVAPRAQLVDLETDVLMSHPGFIHASRGALLLSSARMRGRIDAGDKTFTSFATDDLALMYAAISSLCDRDDADCNASVVHNARAPFAPPGGTGTPAVHIASREGLIEAGGLYDRTATAGFLALVGLVVLLIGTATQGEATPRKLLIAAAATVLIAALFSWLIVRTPMPLLSGVNPWAALMIVMAATFGIVALVGLQRHALAIAYRLGNAPFSSAARTKQVDVPSRQNLAAPPNLMRGGFAWLVLLVLVAWAWLALRLPGVRHGLLPWAAEALLTYSQAAIGLAAFVGLLCSAAWAQCAVATARRMATLVQRLNGNGLPSWAALPAFLVGCDVSASEGTELAVAPYAGNAEPVVFRARPRFAVTPLLASSSNFAWLDSALSGGSTVEQQRNRLCAMQFRFDDNLRERALLALVLARQVETARHSFYYGFGMAMALPLLAYSYPICGADTFALLGLALVLLGALYFALLLFRLQHISIMDRLLCDGEGKTKIEYQTLIAFLSPILMAMFAWLVVEVPGVLDWSGGVLNAWLGVVK